MAELTPEERAIAYIETMRQHFATYHHHKEQMAFVATALYLTGISALTIQKEADWAKIFPYCITNVLVIAISALAIAFVVWQLRRRALADHIVSACDRLRRRWVETYPNDLSASCAEFKGILMPAFLRQELENMSPLRFCSTPFIITVTAMTLWCVMLLVRIYMVTYPPSNP